MPLPFLTSTLPFLISILPFLTSILPSICRSLWFLPTFNIFLCKSAPRFGIIPGENGALRSLELVSTSSFLLHLRYMTVSHLQSPSLIWGHCLLHREIRDVCLFPSFETHWRVVDLPSIKSIPGCFHKYCHNGRSELNSESWRAEHGSCAGAQKQK